MKSTTTNEQNQFLNAWDAFRKRGAIARTFAMAAVTAIVLGLVPAAKAADQGCSSASLTGTFAYTVTGFLVAAPAPIGPYGEAGAQTFDGRGGTTARGMASINGNIVPQTNTGTYTVNSDCSGTFTLQVAPGVSVHYFFVIGDSGNEIHAVCLDPVAVITRIERRQVPTGDWRQ
ncbi:MAG TPA: hypothetical protein VKB79_01530 [Bryobacteraceae bacterium]|nr:hypothetical protein [Bryobacteraceae bacterium]